MKKLINEEMTPKQKTGVELLKDDIQTVLTLFLTSQHILK